MNIPFLIGMGGLAIFDSLNPSLFIAQFFLLTTPSPTKRVIAYIAGIYTVYFLGGLLIIGGARTLILSLVSGFTPTHLYLIQLAVGLLLLGFAIYLFVKPQGAAMNADAKKPRSLHPIHSFVLGSVVIFNELTTALPYFVAIERIVDAQLTALEIVLVLAIYNLIFVVPLFIFLWLFLRSRERFTHQIEGFNRGLNKWLPRILRYGCLILGVIAAADAVVFLTRGAPLFMVG
jgi:cytochrome c biogenesis protein CcdA